METTRINQGEYIFLHTVKTVEWLTENTDVSIFDPVAFEGYQRKIDERHCEKIVKYLLDNFYLPTPIICACDGKYEDDIELRIVDGQHRVEAFKKLKKDHVDRYEQIKNHGISVIIMEKVAIEQEIDTFITINKTSKRVDTSLAYVLKNKLNLQKSDKELTISKLDYMSVELAVKMNESNPYWKNRISFTGRPSNDGPQTISLNAFVKATRRLIGQLDKKKIIEISWRNEQEIELCINRLFDILNNFWITVTKKWSGLFNLKKINDVKIIQGPIGYTSLTRYVANEINNLNPEEVEKIIEREIINEVISVWINEINLSENIWKQGSRFSTLSSEAGYNIIVSELKESINI